MELQWDSHEYDLPSRDSQRQRVYDAESACFRDARIKMQATRDQLQSMADAIFSSTCVRDLLLRSGQSRRAANRTAPRIDFVTDNRRAAIGTAGVVKLPAWARNKPTFLHELAHAVAPWMAMHSWAFCATMLELVREFMGQDWAERLAESYDRHRIKYTPQRQHRIETSRS
jgi:hypothetical protein